MVICTTILRAIRSSIIKKVSLHIINIFTDFINKVAPEAWLANAHLHSPGGIIFIFALKKKNFRHGLLTSEEPQTAQNA